MRHLDNFVYQAQPGTEGLRSTIYRPVNESFSHIPARTRRLLTNTRQKDKAKTFYELLEQVRRSEERSDELGMRRLRS